MWTMLDGFQNLTKSEIDSLVEAPALITILIGAADGELDPEERKWTERLLRTRTYNRPKELNEYYRVVLQDFWDKVQAFMASLPVDPTDRNEAISARLEKINPVLAKLEVDLASDLYQGFIGLAEETAKASGGFLRMGAISAVESKWVNLPMLEPIQHEHEGEEVDSED